MKSTVEVLLHDPTVTSTATEVRLWLEGLDYNFWLYGETFEEAEIDGERLLRITPKRLAELGMTRTDHQDKVLRAISNISKKDPKKTPAAYAKPSEQLKHSALDIIFMITERRRERSLYGIDEQPPADILKATRKMINTIKKILNILKRPRFDCMSEFSSLKDDFIKYNMLLGYFCEQSCFSHEMESDIVDVCKKVNKMCHYLIGLDPDLPETKKKIPARTRSKHKRSKTKMPIITESEVMTFTTKPEPDSVHPTGHPSVIITTTSSSSEPVLSLQDVSIPTKRLHRKLEYFFPERLSIPSNEKAVMLQSDEGNESRTEVSDTKGSEILFGSLDYKCLRDIIMTEGDTSFLDSGSEKYLIDSDTDKSIASEYDFEQSSRSSTSIKWETDSRSEKSSKDSHSTKTEKCPMASGTGENVAESKENLETYEQSCIDYDFLKYWTDPDSEKLLADFEKYMVDSSSESLGLDSDSDSEKCPVARTFSECVLEIEKHQMAADAVKRLMESEKYVKESETEKSKVDLSCVFGEHLVEEGKPQNTRSKMVMTDSDAEKSGKTSSPEKYTQTSAVVEVRLSSETEELSKLSQFKGDAVDLASKGLEKASDTMKPLKRVETCQSVFDLERFYRDIKSEFEKCWTDSERKQLEFDSSGCLGSSRRYQRFVRHEDNSGSDQDYLQKYGYNITKKQVASYSEKHRTSSENERDQNEFESKRHLVEMEQVKCSLQFENGKLQMEEGKKTDFLEADSENQPIITFESGGYDLDPEEEGQRLGARRKGNRPEGFWQPVLLTTSRAQETAEQHLVQQEGNRISRIKHVRNLHDEKFVKVEKVSSTLRERQATEKKLECSDSPSPDENILTGCRQYRKITRKISSKSRSVNPRYTVFRVLNFN